MDGRFEGQGGHPILDFPKVEIPLNAPCWESGRSPKAIFRLHFGSTLEILRVSAAASSS